jgi:hypothetical protein
MAGGAAEEAGGGSSSERVSQLTEQYWLDLWAFGTSPDGLGLTELGFWLLTYPEFTALKRQWERARGIASPLTKEQAENLANGRRYILEAQARAHNKVIAARKEQAEKRGMRIVRPGRRVANGGRVAQ